MATLSIDNTTSMMCTCLLVNPAAAQCHKSTFVHIFLKNKKIILKKVGRRNFPKEKNCHGRNFFEIKR